MELSKVLTDENLKCDFCNKNIKLRKIIANSKNLKELVICQKCRESLLTMLKIELM